MENQFEKIKNELVLRCTVISADLHKKGSFDNGFDKLRKLTNSPNMSKIFQGMIVAELNKILKEKDIAIENNKMS
jgi:hypothetical protein